MKILLTGSSGWLGRHLAPLLQSRGHEVTGLDVAPGLYTRVTGSVADRDLVFQTVAHYGIEAIIHAGALHKPDIVRFPRQTFIDVNVSGTLNLLEAAVEAGHGRFLFTSTTSLMVRADVRAGAGEAGAWWMDEDFGPLEPRNIYGVTKLAAENLCRLIARESGMAVAILRTGRFFPEDDDTHAFPSGPNLKANELLNRRLTVGDAARAHLAALYDRCGWVLPEQIERVYDPAKAERLLGWRAGTNFASVLRALREDADLPFAHDPAWVSPVLTQSP
ncbi:MAG: NAD(P)-dependent oxidoreductase [Novosphingobium sp.]